MRDDDIQALLREAAETHIRPRWRRLQDSQIHEKSPGDLVTVADREAEIAITRALQAADPHCLVVGEEATAANPELVAALVGAERAWTVDPVDGTRNFVAGSPDYGVMVAEVRRGETVRSWIFQPEHDVIFACERGAGVRRNGEALAPIPRHAPFRGAASRADLRGLITVEIASVGPTAMSCALDYPMVLSGELDFVTYVRALPWDHLPGALMLSELGGAVRMRGGASYGVGVGGRHLVAAASPATAEAVTGLWDLAALTD